MSIFDPIWKTDNEQKKRKALASVGKINDIKKLLKIATDAPLNSVRAKAVRQLKAISDGNFFISEADCTKTLLSLDIDDINSLIWLKNFLFNKIRDEQSIVNIMRNAVNRSIKSSAVEYIKSDDLLFEISQDSSLNSEFRLRATEKIRNEQLLKCLSENSRLLSEIRTAAIIKINDQEYLINTLTASDNSSVRAAAVFKINDRKLLKRLRRESDDLKVKQCACGILGHNMEFAEYINKMNGGKDAVYKCTICGYEKTEPYEFSTNDTV